MEVKFFQGNDVVEVDDKHDQNLPPTKVGQAEL